MTHESKKTPDKNLFFIDDWSAITANDEHHPLDVALISPYRLPLQMSFPPAHRRASCFALYDNALHARPLAALTLIANEQYDMERDWRYRIDDFYCDESRIDIDSAFRAIWLHIIDTIHPASVIAYPHCRSIGISEKIRSELGLYPLKVNSDALQYLPYNAIYILTDTETRQHYIQSCQTRAAYNIGWSEDARWNRCARSHPKAMRCDLLAQNLPTPTHVFDLSRGLTKHALIESPDRYANLDSLRHPPEKGGRSSLVCPSLSTTLRELPELIRKLEKIEQMFGY